MGGTREVPVPGGKIDLLTKTQIIEVKKASKCTQALGQILVYSIFYPNHQKRVHLFGKANYKLIEAFEEQCKLLNIIVTWD